MPKPKEIPKQLKNEVSDDDEVTRRYRNTHNPDSTIAIGWPYNTEQELPVIATEWLGRHTITNVGNHGRQQVLYRLRVEEI